MFEAQMSWRPIIFENKPAFLAITTEIVGAHAQQARNP
jgi:hypothetical protein